MPVSEELLMDKEREEKNYCFHYYLPMRHSADNDRTHEHSHTLEIVTYVRPVTEESIQKFDKIEAYADEVIKQYENCYLNDHPSFRGRANIEDIGEVLFQEAAKKLERNGVALERLEIGENPLRTYIVTTYV